MCIYRGGDILGERERKKYISCFDLLRWGRTSFESEESLMKQPEVPDVARATIVPGG
jgi:hypothetical protein